MILVQPKIEVENYDGMKIMKNIERAMRTCYRTEGSIDEDSYKRLIKIALDNNHGSVMEHEKITIRMVCDIGIYKDLTRHRFGSFSVESTRYCNYSKDKFDNQIRFIEPVYFDDYEKASLWTDCMNNIEDYYMKMVELGCKPDELRMILPHSTAAQVTMTANIREWRHILSLRCAKAAHPAIRQILIPLLLNFKENMPELFADINYDIDFPVEKYAEISVIQD